MDTDFSRESPLPEDQYYHHQIIGLRVKTADGVLIGTVTEVLSGKSNDNYIVTGTQGEVLVPAIEDVIQKIDIDRGEMIIEPMEGLLDLNRKNTELQD